MIEEDLDDNSLYNISKPQFGDLVIYNYESKQFDTMSKERCGIENDKAIVGIVVQVNDDMTMDVLMKNYLTQEPLLIPYRYMNSPSFIPAYLKDMFDRYCNKYQRTSVIDINTFKYKIPQIALLDFVNKNLYILIDVIKTIWDEDRSNQFLERLYKHGLLSIHKGKYYRWLPRVNEKRKIENLLALTKIEFLPVFTLKYN